MHGEDDTNERDETIRGIHEEKSDSENLNTAFLYRI